MPGGPPMPGGMPIPGGPPIPLAPAPPTGIGGVLIRTWRTSIGATGEVASWTRKASSLRWSIVARITNGTRSVIMADGLVATSSPLSGFPSAST